MKGKDDPIKAIAAYQFKKYIFDELSFKIKKTESMGNQKKAAKLNISISTGLFEEAETYKDGYAKITCVINDDDAKLPFEVRAVMKGFFKTDIAVSEDCMRSFLELNGVTAMFPFLRSAIADLTKNSGGKMLLLPLFNISQMVKERKKEEKNLAE